jgi:hypothetical protein
MQREHISITTQKYTLPQVIEVVISVLAGCEGFSEVVSDKASTSSERQYACRMLAILKELKGCDLHSQRLLHGVQVEFSDVCIFEVMVRQAKKAQEKPTSAGGKQCHRK